MITDTAAVGQARWKQADGAAAEVVSEADRMITAWISRETVDRDGDVLIAAGCKLDNYLRNPVLLWMHDTHAPPIGRAVEVERVAGEGVRAVLQFADTLMGDEIFRLYAGGFLNAFSHWFQPISWSEEPVLDGQLGYTYREWEPMEFSGVTVPANADALMERAAELDGLALAIVKTLRGDSGGERRPTGTRADGVAVDDEPSAAGSDDGDPDGPPLEEQRIAEDVKRLCGAAEALRNITRHDRKAGSEQRVTAEAIEPAMRSLDEIVGIETADNLSGPGVDAEPDPQDAPEDTRQEQAEPHPPDGALSGDTLRELTGMVREAVALVREVPTVHADRVRSAIRDERRRHIGGR